MKKLWNGNGRKALWGTLAGSLLAVVSLSPGAREALLEWGKAWGPGFVIAAGLLYLAHLHGPRFIAAQEANAVALGSLSHSVAQLAEREQSWQREQDVLLNHVARTQEEMRNDLRTLTAQMNEHLERSVKFAGTYELRLARLEKRRGRKT